MSNSRFLSSGQIWGAGYNENAFSRKAVPAMTQEAPDPLSADEMEMDDIDVNTPESMHSELSRNSDPRMDYLVDQMRLDYTPQSSASELTPEMKEKQLDDDPQYRSKIDPTNKRISIMVPSQNYKRKTQTQSVAFGAGRRESLAWQVSDQRGYRILQGMDRYGPTPEAFTKDESNDEGRTRDRRIKYIEGIRGIVGVQTLLWIFFRIFAPAIVVNRDLDGVYPATFVNDSPQWMNLIRKILSPCLFDGDLQMTMFLILTGRVVLLTFLERREPLSLAGPCFRRPFRLIFPIAITLGIVTALSITNGFKYANFMSEQLHNQAAQAPKKFNSALEFINSLFTFFMAPTTEKDARAVAFIPPSGISWYLEVAFQQVYVLTVYAWVLPFVTLKYKVTGVVAFVALTAWVGRWSWYTLTGLGIAEFAVVYKQMLMPSNPAARRLSVAGLRQNSKVVWIAPIIFVFLGIFFKYLWADVLPQDALKEIKAHASQDNAGLNYDTNPVTKAYPRYDNWLLCTGLLLLVELSPLAQRVLSWKPLVYLGRLSFSIALLSGTIMLSLGSLVYYHLVSSMHMVNQAAILAILFAIFVPMSLVSAHIFSILVDDSSLFFSRFMFKVSRS
jgi:peptidoglycan/LPS O-acetylase OafA/YrhL